MSPEQDCQSICSAAEPPAEKTEGGQRPSGREVPDAVMMSAASTTSGTTAPTGGTDKKKSTLPVGYFR